MVYQVYQAAAIVSVYHPPESVTVTSTRWFFGEISSGRANKKKRKKYQMNKLNMLLSQLIHTRQNDKWHKKRVNAYQGYQGQLSEYCFFPVVNMNDRLNKFVARSAKNVRFAISQNSNFYLSPKLAPKFLFLAAGIPIPSLETTNVQMSFVVLVCCHVVICQTECLMAPHRPIKWPIPTCSPQRYRGLKTIENVSSNLGP